MLFFEDVFAASTPPSNRLPGGPNDEWGRPSKGTARDSAGGRSRSVLYASRSTLNPKSASVRTGFAVIGLANL